MKKIGIAEQWKEKWTPTVLKYAQDWAYVGKSGTLEIDIEHIIRHLHPITAGEVYEKENINI